MAVVVLGNSFRAAPAAVGRPGENYESEMTAWFSLAWPGFAANKAGNKYQIQWPNYFSDWIPAPKA
jgi:hypothetical protein